KVQTNPRSRPGQGPTLPPSPTAGSQSSWGGILSASSRKDLRNGGGERDTRSIPVSRQSEIFLDKPSWNAWVRQGRSVLGPAICMHQRVPGGSKKHDL